MVRCEILMAARYADYEGSGTNRKARYHRVGELVRFPPDYAKDLEDMDMVEILEDPDVTEAAVIEIDEEVNEEEVSNIPPPSDSALEYAAEHHIDLNTGDVVGTGADGRIILADVRRYRNSLSTEGEAGGG